jgi:hypothetical protein
MKRDYHFLPEELPHSAQYRWGKPETAPLTDLKYFQPLNKTESPKE